MRLPRSSKMRPASMAARRWGERLALAMCAWVLAGVVWGSLPLGGRGGDRRQILIALDLFLSAPLAAAQKKGHGRNGDEASNLLSAIESSTRISLGKRPMGTAVPAWHPGSVGTNGGTGEARMWRARAIASWSLRFSACFRRAKSNKGSSWSPAERPPPSSRLAKEDTR
jgi:hypothetical protein